MMEELDMDSGSGWMKLGVVGLAIGALALLVALVALLWQFVSPLF